MRSTPGHCNVYFESGACRLPVPTCHFPPDTGMKALQIFSVVQGNAVVAALVELFRSFAAEESKVWGSGQRQVVSPAALRKALHAWSQTKFHVGAFLPPTPSSPPPLHPFLLITRFSAIYRSLLFNQQRCTS